MSDTGRSMGGNADEDRLPWLEPVEDETAEEGVSAARLIAGLVVALVALGLVVGGVYWLKQRAAIPARRWSSPRAVAASIRAMPSCWSRYSERRTRPPPATRR